jgi:hypothetical protein
VESPSLDAIAEPEVAVPRQQPVSDLTGRSRKDDEALQNKDGAAVSVQAYDPEEEEEAKRPQVLHP